MLNLINIELGKIFRRPRSYIGIIAIAFVTALIHIGIYWEGENMLDFIINNLKKNFYFQGNLMNGYLITYIILNSLWIHLPLLIVIVTGDLVAGESNMGTFRLILTRPVSRISLLTSKYFSGIVYSTLMVFFIALVSLIPGILVFGKGDLIVLGNSINIFAEDDVMWRFLYAFSFGVLSMATVTSLSFLLSTFSSNSLGPIITTMVIIIAFNVISTINVGIFRAIRPFIFTTYLNAWRYFFEFNINYKEVIYSLIILLIHNVVFFGAAILFFNRKDILT